MTCSGPSPTRPRKSCNRSKGHCGASPPAATPPARCAARISRRSGWRPCPIPIGVAPARKAAVPRAAAVPAAESGARAARDEPVNAPSASGVITITTDFGHQGPFVGVMKGCMLARFPAARIIDLTHEIVVHWPAEAGFWLARACGYFPAGTVHVAVVDPGVGTSRSIVAVRAGGHLFLAPDNGLLAPVVSRASDALIVRLGAGELARLGVHHPSATFHGRDIFAPVAAELAAGRCQPEDLGERVSALVPSWVEDPTVEPRSVTGVVISIDHFGNLITNIDAALI